MKQAEVFAYEKLEKGVKIWRCYSWDKQVEVPELLEGLPVTELAAYAFSRHMDTGLLKALEEDKHLCYGTRDGEVLPLEEVKGKLRDTLPPELCGMELEAVSLPARLEKIGKYAFYNCGNMKRFSFYSSISDLGAGLFTGCHQIRGLAVTIVSGQPSCFKEILLELSEELRVDYWEEGNYARLLFPEFYEEGVENTPARILMTQVHGSGLPFRNCFLETRFQFSWYDERFALARFQETEEFAMELALARLFYPLELSGQAKADYEEYIGERLQQAGQWLLERDENQKLMCLLKKSEFQDKVTEGLLSALTEYAGKKRKAETVSSLMDLRHQLFAPKMKTFEL